MPGKGWKSGLFVVVLCLMRARLWAAEPDFHFDPVDYHGSRFLTVVLLFGMGLVLYSLIRYRGNTPTPLAWGLLVANLIAIPAVVLPLGTVLVVARAEKPEFCATCHLAMKGHIDDMMDPKSESLAAIHFKNRYIPSNQCYECHTSYGINGTVEAKMSGIVDLYKYYTRTFHKPIKMRTPYPNGDCLKCHGQSVKWLGQHGDFKESVFKGEMRCLDCHGSSNPAHTVKE